VRFERTYCATPSCAPARNSIMTGTLPHEIAFTDGKIAHPEATLGRILSASGYDCHYAGNRSFALGQEPEVCGFEPLSKALDADMAVDCRDFLLERGNKGGREPFFLVASFINPHNICQWAREQDTYLGAIEERHIPDCPVLPANHQVAPFEPQAIRSFAATHPSAFSTGDQTEDPNWWRRYRSAYFRLIELVDSHIGIVLEGLRDSGLYDDTLVVFISDHGDGQGAHKLKQKLVLYEEAARVPLIVKPPKTDGEDCSPTVSSALAHTGLDLMLTFCDYAELDPPSGLRGRSLRPVVEETSKVSVPASWREQLVIEIDRADRTLPGMQMAKHGGQNLIGRAVYDGDYKYIVYDWGRYREQLFDLRTDPGEMVNLAQSSRFAPVLAGMRSFLRGWCAETDDHFGVMIPHGDAPAPY
jgi:arylsulfatase A-like enzyme